MGKVALITGITGMDGSFLAELLLDKGYQVHGITRPSSTFNTDRIEHLIANKEIMDQSLFLHYGDMCDSSNLNRLIDKIQPDEIYNLAAISHVKISFDIPEMVAETDGIGVLRLLDAIKENNKKIKLYQASTSELFGGIPGTEPQNENTPFYPRSPYACAKLYAYYIVKNFREAYSLFASNGILFNHEGIRRHETFLTRKVTMAVARIVNGKQDRISLGNLDAKRDWGSSKDYVQAMYLILQHHKPDDFVISTNETHSVREFCELAFKEVNIEIQWVGNGIDEVGIDKKTGKVLIDVNPKYFRPTEVEILLGDSNKARRELGWTPKTSFEELVSEMVQHDLKLVSGGKII